MTRWIGLHLHSLSLDTWRLRWLTEPTAAAVFEHEVLIAATRGAQQCGLKLGMRCATVRSLAPECLLFPRDEAAEQRAYTQAAQVALAYSPAVYQYSDYTLLIDATSSLRLFGGIRLIVQRLRQQLQHLKLQVRSSVAPTAIGAWLLAQATQSSARYACHPSTLVRLLNGLPCAALPSARPHLIWLKAIGCETLGGLRALPRDGLQRRVGTDLLIELDRAYDSSILHQAPYIAPEQFIDHLDLYERLEHTSALTAVAERLAHRLCTWLRAKRYALRSITLDLHYERARATCPPTRLELAFSEPVWLVNQLMPLLREHLSRQVLTGPVVALTLQSQTLMQQSAPSATLFADPINSSANYQRLLDLLSARLGATHVLEAAHFADHRPELANRWVPLREAQSTAIASRTMASATPPSFNQYDPTKSEQPFWLFNRALPLKVHEHRPIYITALQLLRGPERIESGWWDGARIARDYFVAQDQHAVRYWIYRERDHEQARWFLHGLFG